MTLEQIAALNSPEARPPNIDYAKYQELCFRAGVTDPIAKSAWDSLPLFGDPDALIKGDNAEKACVDEVEDHEEEFHGGDKLKKDEAGGAIAKGDGEYGDEDEVGDGGEESAAGDETEVAESDTDEAEESMEEAEKGGIEVSDLMKAIDAYSTVEDALAVDPDTSREDFLTARLDAGTISKSERSELGRIWSGSEPEDEEAEPMHKSLTETIREDDNSGHLVDASDFLRTLVKGVDTRMEQVLGEVNRDGRATRELMKAQGSLIKSLAHHASQQDELIKAMATRLEQVESSPAPRRAVTARPDSARNREFSKSVIAESGDNRLNKAQVTDGLRALMIHASESDDQGAMNRIAHATSLYEQTGEIPESVIAAVRQIS